MNSASKFFFFLSFASLFISAYLYWQQTTPKNLNFKIDNISKLKYEYPKKEIYPVRITIRDVDIDLAIFPAEIRNNEWDTTTYGASYLKISALPGDMGNSVMYGHNWNNIFGNLTKLKKGQEIDILMNDNTQRLFKVVSTSVLSPDQSSVLDQTNDKRLTLYTCTGFLDKKRFVVTAILKEQI